MWNLSILKNIRLFNNVKCLIINENNENIIKSAFSFSDSGLELNIENGKNNSNVNVWNISKWNSLNSLKSQQITIQEEYKTYGTVEKLIAIDQNLAKFFPLPLHDETVLVFASFL